MDKNEISHKKKLYVWVIQGNVIVLINHIQQEYTNNTKGYRKFHMITIHRSK